MRAGLAFLVLAYILSQFYRAVLAVMSPVLQADIGATPEDLARASGLWFLAFALMQLPVGWALDRIGPRRTASIMFGLGAAGGAIVFATAQGPWAVKLAMTLIGIGCAPILMATYFIFARIYSAAVFGTLAGVTVGVSSLGNIASAAPMAWAIETFGWRECLGALAVISLLVALAIARLVQDPKAPEGEPKGSVFDLLRDVRLWPILIMMFVCYAPAAGLRGLWIGPYVTEVFGADLAMIGTVTLVMGLAMVAGNFAYGPLDRLLGTRKWVIIGGNAVAAACCLSFWFTAPGTIWAAAAIFAVIGLCGASYPMVLSHGRSLVPAHLTGRGVTLLNLFGMGGAGVMQFASGPYFAGLSGQMTVADAYGRLFGIFGLVVVLGLCVYLFSRDTVD
jgi:predicted MFS family arabinose efflux permease